MNQRMITQPGRLIALLALAAVAVTLPLWLEQYYVQLSTRSLFLGITAMSFILLAGYGGMLSLAQMSFFAMAGYVIGIGWKDYDLPFEVLIPLAVVGATALSAVFGLIAIRARGIYFLVMTLALAQLFQGVALQWASVTNGYNGIAGIARPVLLGRWPLQETMPLYYTALVTTLLCYLVLRRVVNSPFGIALQGIRDNPQRMAALGFNVQRHRLLIIIISGAIAGVAGVVGVFHNGVIAPHTANLQAAVLVVMASLVGGVTRLEGGVLGAFITVLLINWTSELTQRYWMIVGIVFVLVVMFVPDGLLGSRLPWLARLRGGLARRRGVPNMPERA